jgi:hypothetical protein
MGDKGEITLERRYDADEELDVSGIEDAVVLGEKAQERRKKQTRDGAQQLVDAVRKHLQSGKLAGQLTVFSDEGGVTPSQDSVRMANKALAKLHWKVVMGDMTDGGPYELEQAVTRS